MITHYNIAGDYNFAAQSQVDVAEHLEKPSQEVSRAIAANTFNDDTTTYLTYNMKKAVHQACKHEADKSTVLKYLGKAKELISTHNVTGD